MGQDTAAFGQPRGKSMTELAHALRRVTEYAPSSVEIRRGIVDDIYERLLSAADAREIAAVCGKFVAEGLPDDKVLANSIVGELLQRFEASKSDMLGDVGVCIMHAVGVRYGASFVSLREFHDATRSPADLVTDNFRQYVDEKLAVYNAAVVPLKKEYQDFAKLLGHPISDEALAQLTLSELLEITGDYMNERYELNSKDSGKMYEKIVKGNKEEHDEGMEQLLTTPYPDADLMDRETAISKRMNEPVQAAASEIADFIKEVDSRHVIIDMLSYALVRIGMDHYLALELIRKLAPEEIDGYAVGGEHVNVIAKALTSKDLVKVFSMRRKLLAMISRQFQRA